MISIALVEDELIAVQSLQRVLDVYAKENDVTFSTTHFPDAVSFLAEYEKNHHRFDIVFMDIEMPMLNGMDAAFKLREMDKQIIIIFVTNMSQYAVRGYEVDALYYIMKPINYQNTAQKLKKALSILTANDGAEIVLAQTNGIIRLSTKSVMYIEIISHKLIYHTMDGNHTAYGTLSKLEDELRPHHFFRCNSCYLVNARYIASISGHTITLQNSETLQISHPKKKQFMTDITNWLGGGNA